MNFKSVKIKLVLYYLIIFSGVFLLLNLLIYSQFYKLMLTEIDKTNVSKSEEIADIIESLSISELQDMKSGHLEEDKELDMLYSKQYLQIFDKDRHLILKSKNLEKISLPLPQTIQNKGNYQTIELENEKFYNARIFTRFSKHQKYIIQVGSSLNFINKSIHKILFLVLIGLPFAILISILVGIFLANLAFKPIKKIIKTAKQIQGENLSLRLEKINSGDEIEELSNTINTMLDRLENSFQEIKNFSARASHELRTPLTIIRGVTEVALRKNRSKEEYKKVLLNVLEEIKNLQRIINNLLTLARLNEAHFNSNSQIINLTHFVETLYKESLVLTEGKHITMTLNNEEKPIYLLADDFRLKEMFLNIISNSIKYTNQNGTIQITLFQKGKDAVIVIKDTGIGISKKDLPHIFDPFYKGAQADRESTGIGLSIVKKIAEYHHGTIQIESQENVGTKVIIKLPLEKLN